MNVPAGSYQIEVVYIGYQNLTQEVTVEEGKNIRINLSMTTGSENLSEVVVSGDRLKGQARALNQQKQSKHYKRNFF